MNGPFHVFLKIIACQKVHHFEKFGSYMILIGILIMLFDPYAKRVGEKHNFMVLFAILGNIPGVYFWRLMK